MDWEELLHKPFLVGFEQLDFLGLCDNELIEGGKAVGYLLLFTMCISIARRSGNRQASVFCAINAWLPATRRGKCNPVPVPLGKQKIKQEVGVNFSPIRFNTD